MKKIITLVGATLLSIVAFGQWHICTTANATNCRSVSFTDENNGVVVGTDNVSGIGNVYRTTDGGVSWNLVQSSTEPYNDVYFQNATQGWMAADNGYVFQSGNGGQTWSAQVQLGTKNLNCIFFGADSVGYVAGDDGVLYRTQNMGATWTAENSGTLLSINDIYFTDDMNGWIVGDGGYIAATSDGGTTWTQIAQPLWGFMDVQGFAYTANHTNAVSVGTYGDALFSTNSGMNWNSFSSGVSTTLRKVAFANDLAGVIVGDNGIILRTLDGGNTWMRDSVPGVTENLTGIWWASDTLAYICGANGRVLKSTVDISAVNAPSVNPMNVAVFPNPCAEELNIAVDLKNATNVQIEITDVAGRIVLSENEGENFAGKNIFHVQGISSLTTGMYFVRVITADGIGVMPVVKK